MKMKIKNSDEAISEILGTVILLAIVVIAFSVLYVHVLSEPTPSSSPHTSLEAYMQGDSVIIEHRGGESLDIDDVEIWINDTKVSVTDKENIDANGNGKWDVGEYYHKMVSGRIEVMVIDQSTNSIIFSGVLNKS